MISARMERRPKARALGLLVLIVTGMMIAAKPAHADTFTVTNALDSGAGSLRQAIVDANDNQGADTIEFGIPVQAVHTISPTSELPTITGPVTIDGYTQPGSRPNSRPTGTLDGVLLVELNGSNAGAADGLDIRASNVVVRGLVINRFSSDGIETGEDASGVRIEGNFIGTDATGTLDRGNIDDGVDVGPNAVGKHTIGGISPDKRNLISGNNGNPVELRSLRGGDKVQGNLIGTKKDSTSPLGGHQVGVLVQVSDSTIGGTEPGAANVIANGFEEGVRGVFGNGNTGNRILGNSIFDNGGLGIDLGGNGRTLNDPRDADAGPNTLQNFPVLSSAFSVGDGRITIEGTLDSTPSTRKKKRTFTIQFFANPQDGSTSLGEGKTFLGQTRVTTNRRGQASFSFETTKPVPDRDEITATATGPGGNTSEFSDPETVIID